MRPTDAGGVRLEPPGLRRAGIVRPRLLERLAERFSARVTVIVAPAGFGKTTLLAQAVAENRLDPRGWDVWLACEDADSVGSSLARSLRRAMGLRPPEGPGDAVGSDAERVLGTLVEKVWHHTPDDVVFVIDDVHEIAPTSSGAELLTELVALAPRNAHFVFAGRRRPPVEMSRLEVQGHVVRLDESDLLFSEAELAEFAALRGVPEEQLADCGGWPALAELAASATPGVDAQFLWTEVLSRILPDRRRELALLAHVGPVDDALATAVLGHDTEVAELLADLPLVAMTADGGRQIHRLWRPHLAAVVTDDEIAEARRRAGRATARAGDVIAAVHVLMEAAAWDEVGELLAGLLEVPDPRLPSDLLEAWLTRLPATMQDGPLAQLLGVASGGWTDPASAVKGLEAAAEAFRRAGDRNGEVACLAQVARFGWVFERPELMLGLTARLFELEAQGSDKAKPLATILRAAIAQPLGDWEGALAELDRIPARSLSPPWQAVADWLRAMCLNQLGRPGEALKAADRARVAASSLPIPAVDGMRLLALWLLGRIDDVLGELPTFLDRVVATGLDDITAYAASWASTVSALTGRIENAAEYLEDARRAAPTSPRVPMVDVNIVVAEAALALATGDQPRAARLLGDHYRHSLPLGTGMAAVSQFSTLPLWYVLVPESRPVWDQIPLGPAFVTARALARELVAMRETGRRPAGTQPPPPPHVVRSLIPVPWAAELALATIGAGRSDGWALLEALWPSAQHEVRRHASDQTGEARLRRPARTALARLPVPPPGYLELRLLGPVELLRDGALVDLPEWRRERVRSLLAYLVLHPRVSRERLAAELWPTLDAESQSHNLRVNLAHLRRVLEPDRARHDASFLVRTHGGNLVLHPDQWLHTDVWRFDELSRQAIEADERQSPSAALDAMQQAVALWRGDPRELENNGWALPDLEERRLRLVRMAIRAGQLLLVRNQADAARRICERALEVDPWAEAAYPVIIEAHLAMEEHRAAAGVLERYQSVLAEIGPPSARASDRLQRLVRLVHQEAGTGLLGP